MVYDIGLICFMNLNIGNNLTNYALYKYLSEKGYSVLLADVRNYSMFLDMDRLRNFKNNPYPDAAISEKILNNGDVACLNEMCTFFVTGSDQLFRFLFLEMTDYRTVDSGIGSYKYKIAYGTSFGEDHFEANEYNTLKAKYYFKRFQQISVREKSGQRLLKEKFDIDAEVVLDPVFLCDRKDYDRMAESGDESLENAKYVASYVLTMTANKESVIRSASSEWSDENSVTMLNAETDGGIKYNGSLNVFRTPSVEDWLSAIRNSEFVVTDSFHGVCFSIIYHKQFCVMFEKENVGGWTRLQNILELFGLEDRFVKCEADYKGREFYTNRIDYDAIDTKLNKLKQSSIKWFDVALGRAGSYKADICEYDLLSEHRSEYYHTISEFEHALKMHDESFTELAIELRKIRSDIYLSRISSNIIDTDSLLLRKQNTMNHDMTVIGWGTGACFRRNIDRIIESYPLKYICDNNPNNWGIEIKGVKCLSPKEVQGFTNPFVVIMVDSPAVTMEIARQLLEMGICNFDHVVNWLEAMG
ncbi:polysaccharide pyruvyl transferase family protein [Butyrivibrio sp. VCB2001]|uniref:polysaccharide pyruvyl transferase family protein n=1 Tax=Butyrivibrio sp. VCB2001 TaxID=1280667 RepID=UPI0004003E10|nr:polysaccharide pyruvyl transferase family protein [Butyrivibrio sp. VCB2001]